MQGVKDGCIMLDAHCEESSTDDIDNVNNDNYVTFVGDNIIIGRSNLRKENSPTKKVSFIAYKMLFYIILCVLLLLSNHMNFIFFIIL